MGAEWFVDCTDDVSNADEAFDKLVHEAYFNYGHNGYSGTICEKDGYITFPIPEFILEDIHSYHDVEDLIEYVSSEGYNAMGHDKKGKKGWAAKVYETIDDKWGPAGCFIYNSNYGKMYYFFGWASC